ncbi:2OG-Fe(II) oxygenase [Hirschia baltica]|uniref:Proline hydroxylase n=1 Tax=Hirschia baltica (strain ATCC 49814 / DSM 5838 / IFAM 1418) TaxID=582402 RepID=C6XQU6_HIRBI|nr:2OG-Fe(II) oxygenase family protein [Hirschia baltica]ACT58702.1 proline hydroxylase [Hirschia baltica ATCC 49814]
MDSNISIKINPDIDIKKYAALYEERGIVQIPDFFETNIAEMLFKLFATQVNWRVLYTNERNMPVEHAYADWLKMPENDRNLLLNDVLLRARENRGYLYDFYPMVRAKQNGWDPGHTIHKLTDFINSDIFLDIGRKLTNTPHIIRADAAACRYNPGHYLTRHLDFGKNNERRAAYVLGLSKIWQPDWGGLLLFLNKKQDVEQGLLPRFNNLTVFDTKFLHSVSQVSSFAALPRFTVSGWFRDKG